MQQLTSQETVLIVFKRQDGAGNLAPINKTRETHGCVPGVSSGSRSGVQDVIPCVEVA